MDAASTPGEPLAVSEVEQKEEELCEYERYVGLYHDLDAAAEREGEIFSIFIQKSWSIGYAFLKY